MSDYDDEPLAAWQYEEVIDDLEDEIHDLKKERENILSDIEFMENKEKIQAKTIVDLKFEVEKVDSENRQLKEELQSLSFQRYPDIKSI